MVGFSYSVGQQQLSYLMVNKGLIAINKIYMMLMISIVNHQVSKKKIIPFSPASSSAVSPSSSVQIVPTADPNICKP